MRQLVRAETLYEYEDVKWIMKKMDHVAGIVIHR